MKHATHVVLLIACTGMAVAQVKTTFVDNSPAGNPMSLAGSKDKTGQCNITLHNNSPRPVVAVVVDFEGGPNVAAHMIHDHFFMSDEHVAMHGNDFEMSFPCSDWKTVTMTTKFIQSNDGQLWEESDAKTVGEIAAQRRDAIDYLNEVVQAPDTKAKLAQVTKATRDVNGNLLTARNHERDVLRSADDPIGTAKERLANGEAHSAWLLNLVK